MPRLGILTPGKLFPAALLLLLSTTFSTAQHREGHGITTGTVELNRPDGVDERDSLKDFHRAVAVQATSRQIAEFQDVIKSTTAAQEKLHVLAIAPDKQVREGITSIDQALEDARSRSKKFQEGFSEPQKSGLKEFTKRLEKVDADLDQEAKRFDQSFQQESAAENLSAHATSVERALTDFSNAQLALGREMGITLATAQDVKFALPKVTTRVNIGHRAVVIGVSGVLSQTASQDDQRTFQFEATVDLSELQRSLTEILNAELYSTGCGGRLTVKRATIVPATPASSLGMDLHYERWSCLRLAGQTSMTELAESDGMVELTLTPTAGNSNVLHLTPEFKRISATGAMADDLRSGDLGDTVRDKVSSAVLLALMVGTDFKSTLPGALQNGVSLQNVKFQDPSSSGLKAVLQGQVHLSNEQVRLLASQLNQTLSAQESPPPATTAPAPQTK